MDIPSQIAAQFRELYLNGHWVATNLLEQLSSVSWQQATTRIGDHNPIALLAFHINYYVAGQIQVLEGGLWKYGINTVLTCLRSGRPKTGIN